MILFRDRNLNIAILISASWHLICILCVTPVLAMGNIRANLATISFLGSILERIVIAPERPVVLDKVYFIQHIESAATGYMGKIALNPPQTIAGPDNYQVDKDELVSWDDKGKAPVVNLHTESRQRQRIEFGDILVAGDAKNRVVLYKPDLPKRVFLDSYLGSERDVIVSFKISRHGFVLTPECAVSSGSPEIDALALRYVGRWQFVPQEEEKGRPEQGMVRIRIK